MVLAQVPEAIAGLLLVFFVPGYTLTKATFPEWRLRGPTAPLRLLETVTAAFVLSVVLTILVGYLLLTAAPGGFQSYYSNPVLEVALAGVAAVAFAFGWARGAYRRDPPPPHVGDADPGSEGAWELTRELDRLAREERRLRHELRTGSSRRDEEAALQADLERVRARREELRLHREAEYGTQ
jgi:hypothetical protein